MRDFRFRRDFGGGFIQSGFDGLVDGTKQIGKISKLKHKRNNWRIELHIQLQNGFTLEIRVGACAKMALAVVSKGSVSLRTPPKPLVPRTSSKFTIIALEAVEHIHRHDMIYQSHGSSGYIFVYIYISYIFIYIYIIYIYIYISYIFIYIYI